MDFADGFASATLIRQRQLSSSLSPLSSSSSDYHRPPQKDVRFYSTLQKEYKATNLGSGSERNRSQENGMREPSVTETTPNELNQSMTVAFRSQVQIPVNDIRTGSRISRSRSELPPCYRYPFWTSKSLAGPEVEEDAGMLDFISTEAPDDTLIKPSVLRTSMLTRRREKDPGEETALRRTVSLREHSTNSFYTKQENNRLTIDKPSSGFEDGKPLPTNGDSADKKILKVAEGHRVWKIAREEAERKSTPSALRNSVYEHRFQPMFPSFQEGTSSGSNSILGTNSGIVLTPTTSTYQGNIHGTVSGTSSNSVSYLTSSSGKIIRPTVPGTVQGTVTEALDRRQPMKFRSASMERWRLQYERLVEGKGGEEGGAGGGGGGGGSSDHIDSSSTPKSQENIIMTQLVVMLTPQGDKIVSSSSGGGVSTPKKSSSSGALDYGEEKDVEENGNRKKTVWNGKELGTTETKAA